MLRTMDAFSGLLSTRYVDDTNERFGASGMGARRGGGRFAGISLGLKEKKKQTCGWLYNSYPITQLSLPSFVRMASYPEVMTPLKGTISNDSGTPAALSVYSILVSSPIMTTIPSKRFLGL